MASERSIDSLMYRSVKQGFSFNSFYRSAREHGYETYRRSDMLSRWAEVRTEVQNAVTYSKLLKTEIPKVTEVSELKFTQPGRYYYRLRTEAEPFKGGPRVERFVTVVSEEPLTVGEITGQLTRKWRGYDYGKEERLVQMELVAALHRAA